MYSADTRVYTDFQGLAKLRTAAQKDSGDALEETAQQFEAVMMQMMLKSMRQASSGEEMMDSDQSLFYRDMYDQQIAIHLAKSGGLGLADVIKRQLGGAGSQVEPGSGKGLEAYRQQAIRAVPVSIKPSAASPLVASAASPANTSQQAKIANLKSEPELDSPEAFLHHLWPLAQKAAGKLGQDPHALIAQAALETGWGRHVTRHADGTSSHNLFNIKADHRWSGDKVAVDTLEYEQGTVVKKRANFRAYDSFADSFNDYVEFLRASPRYEAALNCSGDGGTYLSELQKAGYATDPKYATKITSIMNGKEMGQAFSQLNKAENVPL